MATKVMMAEDKTKPNRQNSFFICTMLRGSFISDIEMKHCFLGVDICNLKTVKLLTNVPNILGNRTAGCMIVSVIICFRWEPLEKASSCEELAVFLHCKVCVQFLCLLGKYLLLSRRSAARSVPPYPHVVCSSTQH